MDRNQYSSRPRRSILFSFSASSSSSSSSFLLLFLLLLHLLIIGPANSSLAAADLGSSSSTAASQSNFAEAHAALDLSSTVSAERQGGGRLSLPSHPDGSLSVSESFKPSVVAVQPHLGLTFSSKHKYAFTEKGKSVDIRLAHTTAEDDEISVNVMDRPLHGTLHFPDREEPLITFTPEAEFTGKDSFHYEVCRTRNGNRACTKTQVTIIVRIDVNDDQITTMEGQQVTFSVLRNDDARLDESTLLLVKLPHHGEIDPASGIFHKKDGVIYRPKEGFVGYDSMEYEVCKDATRENCGRAIASITVNLLTIPDVFDVTSKVATKLDVLQNDGSQSHIDKRTLSIAKEPSHGIIVSVDTKSGEVVYLPNRNFAGEDSFAYIVCSHELRREEDMTDLLGLEFRAENALQQVNIIFERSGLSDQNGEEHIANSLHESRKPRPQYHDDSEPTTIDHITSWFAGESASDVLPDFLHEDHSDLKAQLIHLRSVEIFSSWIANHEFYYMRKATVKNRAEVNDTLGEWDIVITEISNKGKEIYGEVEAEIEAAVSRIFATDHGYLNSPTEVDSAVIAQWLWNHHREALEETIQNAFSTGDSTGERKKICSNPVTVTLRVQLWAKDDLISVKEGSTTDVVVLANDHVRADPSTLEVISKSSPSSAKLEVVHKAGGKAVIRYSLPEGFFGRDSFEYQVCTDRTRYVCAQAKVIAEVEHKAVVARNDFFQLPYNPQQHRICPLENDINVDHKSLRIAKRETELGAVLQLEKTDNGENTGCLLYTARSTTGGDDQFHYEVCTPGRGCARAQVRIVVSCSYFDRGSEEVDMLLLKTTVIPQLRQAIASTVEELQKLKQLSEGYDALTSVALIDDIKEWNREIKAFCKESVADMLLMQNMVLARLSRMPNGDCK